MEKLITVDISEDILTVAKNYFGFSPDGKVLESLTKDAYEYVTTLSTGKSEPPFDLLFMDINYSSDDITISPPKKFLEASFLQKLLSLCTPKCSYICINVQIYSSEGMESLMKELVALKESDDAPEVVKYHQVEEARNCIVMIARTQEIGKADKTNGDVLSDTLKSWSIANKNMWLKEFDMAELANSITKEVKAGQQ